MISSIGHNGHSKNSESSPNLSKGSHLRERLKRAPLRTFILVFVTLLLVGIWRSFLLIGAWFILWGGYFVFRLAQEVRRKVKARTRGEGRN